MKKEVCGMTKERATKIVAMVKIKMYRESEKEGFEFGQISLNYLITESVRMGRMINCYMIKFHSLRKKPKWLEAQTRRRIGLLLLKEHILEIQIGLRKKILARVAS
jgi:hypothetical protein